MKTQELKVFLYSSDYFARNVSDAELIAAWGDDHHAVECLTPDELAERINDQCIAYTKDYIRFISVENDMSHRLAEKMIDPEVILLRAVMTRDFSAVKAVNPEFKAAKDSLIEKGLLRQPRSGVIELNISKKYLKEFHYEKHA